MKYARSARRHIMTITLLGFLTALLVIAQVFAISFAISPIITGVASPSEVWTWVAVTAGIAIARALITALREALGHRAAEQAIRELRTEVLRAAEELGPRWRARHSAEVATLLTRGLDNLAPYFVKFLPQLILTMTVTPLALATILYVDIWSAIIAGVVVPLIPIFMILIGRFTQESTDVKLRAMERLSAQLLDLMTGLPTLRALGREAGPRKHLKELGQANTTATMSTLRIAFLSGGALEFLATLSVALVAVEVGMRLVFYYIPLVSGLAVIMLAPEVFEPLRQVGAQFHASADGVAAANAAFNIIEEAEKRRTQPTQDLPKTLPNPATSTITIEGLSVAARGAWAPHNLTATITPGRITALVGPSGVGKTTTIHALLGLEKPTRGRILLHAGDDAQEDPIDLCDVLSDPTMRSRWWEQVAWIPQSPSIVTGTLRSNLPANADEAALAQAAELTGFSAVVAALPQGWDTPVGSGGVGLSVGQRQRLALMNAFLRPAGLIVLDEPTAHLDAVSEETVVSAVQALKAQGKSVIVIAHRPALHAIADDKILIARGAASPEDIEQYPILTPVDRLESLDITLPTFLDEALIADTEDSPDADTAADARMAGSAEGSASASTAASSAASGAATENNAEGARS